jgi:hypothetical protein
MRVMHGRVEQGRIVVDEAIPEGTEVTVVVAAGEDTFDLDEEQIASLLESLEEANLGQLVPMAEVLSVR